MTDIVTLDLFRIHHDLNQLKKLHTLQRDRCAERELTDGDRPDGLRMSIEDPVRRVKAKFDPFWKLSLKEGTGERGHILEDYLEVALFHGAYEPLRGASYESQVPIHWHRDGRSAFDFVVDNASAPVVSCKTSIQSERPSSANVAQERRMMTHAGYPAGTLFDVWVINPGTFEAVGPYRFELDQESIDAERRIYEGVCRAYDFWTAVDDPSEHDGWNDPQFWVDTFGLESTSGAFRYSTLSASPAIERRVTADVHAREALSEAKRAADEAKLLIEGHVREQIELARREDPMAKTIRAYGAVYGEAVYTLVERKDGGSYVKYKLEPHDPSDVIHAA